MIEKYKALEAENKRLKALNVELTAKCNWYNGDGARLERERDELTRQLAEYKAEAGLRDAVPEGFTLVPNGPTEAMISAAMSRYKHQSDSAAINFMQMHRENFKQDYMAMLAAAPKGEKE